MFLLLLRFMYYKTKLKKHMHLSYRSICLIKRDIKTKSVVFFSILFYKKLFNLNDN